MANTSRKTLASDEDVQLTIECSDSHISSVNPEKGSDHSVDNIAAVDTSVNDDGFDNEAEATSAEDFVWECMSNYEERGTT
jgi:hypothetical protein